MLKQSTVVFNEQSHEYVSHEGIFLNGITGMIDRQIFGGAFANLPESVWRDKADQGTTVHNDLEMAVLLGTTPSTPGGLSFYKGYIETGLITPLCPEYLVSDGENFATKIDLVDDKFNLYDYKTSTVLNVESVTWQLSICAYLFEKQNGFKCGKLFAVHITGDGAEIVELTPKPFEAVEALLCAEVMGEKYITPAGTDEQGLAKLVDLENSIVAYKKAVETFEAEKERVLESLTERMAELGIKKWETERVAITRVDPTTRESLDSKKLKAEMPDVYTRYVKTSTVKGGIRVTLKKEKH